MMQFLSSGPRSPSSLPSHDHRSYGSVCSNFHSPCVGLVACAVPGVWQFDTLKAATSFRNDQSFRDQLNRRWKKGHCTAALVDDAPFALAIGASILSTLVLRVDKDQEENKDSSLFGPDDVRSGAMQIISFIPLFNWLVWVFAWLDTRQPKYLVFSAIYIAPYLKTGLSISPDDSWLPVASILACIVHVQLDISVGTEGAPLGDISNLLLEKTQVKDLRIRAEGLVGRLKELAEKSDSRPMDEAINRDDEVKTEEWKAIQEEMQGKEFAEWDAKLLKTKTIEESAKEMDT